MDTCTSSVLTKIITNEETKMETLDSLDMVVVVFATDHLDVKTTYYYGVRDEDDYVIVNKVDDALTAEYGVDAMKGFEVLSIVR